MDDQAGMLGSPEKQLQKKELERPKRAEEGEESRRKGEREKLRGKSCDRGCGQLPSEAQVRVKEGEMVRKEV